MLSRYRILRELGRGPTGALYAASDRTTGAVVALKRLDPSLLTADATLARRFVEQALSARRLKHRNIAQVLDAGEAAGTAYVATEMLEGESLRALLDRGPLPVARAIRIAHEIASGLAHAHLEGAVHGGLAPSNVIVLRSGAAKITDFGIAQPAPGYQSPEQMRGEPVDHRSDLYALGVLLYEMLTGQVPAQGGEPAPPGELNPLLPRALDAMVVSMLAAQPSARMAGMPILLRELERLEGALGLDATARPGAPEPEAAAPPAPPPPQAPPAPPRRSRAPDPEAFEYYRALAEQQRPPAPERSSGSGPAAIAVLALMLSLLALGLTGFLGAEGLMDRWAALTARPPIPPKPVPAPVAEAPREPVTAPAPPPASQPESPPQAVEPKPGAEPLGTGVRPILPPPEQAPLPEPLAAVEPPAPSPPKTLPPPARRSAKTAPQLQPARLILAVSPHGEVYIDGEHRATTPPVTTLEIEPGMRRVEVRNGSRKPFLTYVAVEPGDVRRIRHDFNAKPIRPPR